MTDRDAVHLADDQIDAYWRGELDAAGTQAFEEHYLACPGCLARVQAVEDLIEALAGLEGPAVPLERTPPHRSWPVVVAAAAIIALAVFGTWPRSREPHVPPPAVQAVGAPPRIEVVRLAPPTRDAAAPLVSIPAGGTIRFEVDAREAGAPGTRFQVTLRRDDGTAVTSAAGVASSDAGLVVVDVAAAALRPGGFTFEVKAGADALSIPFQAR